MLPPWLCSKRMGAGQVRARWRGWTLAPVLVWGEPVGRRHLNQCSLSLSTGSTLMIVTEYMSHGALDGFLRVSDQALGS